MAGLFIVHCSKLRAKAFAGLLGIAIDDRRHVASTPLQFANHSLPPSNRAVTVGSGGPVRWIVSELNQVSGMPLPVCAGA
jgi:hypothetical protein